MYTSINFCEFCLYANEQVEITSCTDAATGYGCAISMDEIEFTCSRQNSCCGYNNELCKLRNITGNTTPL